MVLLDPDIFPEDLISVVSPNHDYPAFWRSMMRLAHETRAEQSRGRVLLEVLPEQVLANSDVLNYFDSAHFLLDL